VNTLLVSARPGGPPDAARELEQLTAAQAQLEDVGLTVSVLESGGALAVTSATGLLDDAHAAVVQDAFRAAALQPQPVFTYLANSLQANGREVPYSLVTAIDLQAISPNLSNASSVLNAPNDSNDPPVVLNAWAAAELQAGIGDSVTMEFFVWEEPGQLVTRTSAFRVAAIVPVDAGDRDLAPMYPGISDSPTLDDWDPPFPIDLARIRPQDEEYWQRYRTTPKAFVPLDTGQRLWRSRYGALTSIRAVPPEQPLDAAREALTARLRAGIDPITLGLAVRDVRAEGLSASRGATDFGAYFVYFSFFLVVSALLLAALFFKLGVEQRVREVGLLRAVGFGPAAVRRLFLGEGLLLSLAGSALGVLGALGYASLIMLGLRSWWVDAVGTTALTLHVSPLSLLIGGAGGILAAVVCIWWTLRSLSRISERSLLMGQVAADHGLQGVISASASDRRLVIAGAALAAIALGLLVASAAEWTSQAGAFFGAGSALLGASLCLFLYGLRRRPRSGLVGHGWQPVSRLGLRNATYRPGRSVLSVAVIASATFILIAVDAFRRGDGAADGGRQTGLGGYALLVETLLPVVHDPNTTEGRDALNLFAVESSVRIEPFRLLPGDDASCLNLYQPTNPRILAPRDAFIAEGRFAFQDSLASTAEERENPWRLLHREEADGAIPVIADANSMTYVLHLALGEDMVITRGGREIRLRMVASLRDSIFQGELLMSQANFLRLFPQQEGYRVLLVETPEAAAGDVAAQVEDALVDFGADATGTAERLAQFHRVENTYLSTFQTLGGLGLLLGTVGLGTVLLRNVLERRRELALLSAVGYRRRHVLMMTVAESVLLLAGGLLIGALSAALAIAPAAAERGGRIPLTSGAALLLFAVFLAGLLSSVIAVRAATSAPVLSSLRSE
ncbi:MAG TPA: ABC transporter permease, partial [Gemmatimonadaceae bacterium]|nr:ABC transporter permease [Gemmatimonadaceae bacterium]